jgi:hypothetical protein
MNKKTPFSQSNDKISRLIALPLLKTEIKEGLRGEAARREAASIDTIINIQKMINTRPPRSGDLARFKKGKEYFIEYSKNVSDYLKNTNLNKELKLLELKNYKANNNTNNNRATPPVLQILNTTVDNFIYESATPDSDLINKKRIFNYKNNYWALRNSPSESRRELIFRTYNFIKTISLSGGCEGASRANNSYNVYSFNKNNNLLILDNIYYLLKS